MSQPGDGDLRPQLRRLERLIHEMEEGPESPLRARAREILRIVLELHTDALTRMLDVVGGAGASPILLEACARDPWVSGMLLLHGLHPVDLETRVRTAVEDLAPMLRGHAARIVDVTVRAGAVHVRIERDAGLGGAPATALRASVEDSILAAAPDVVSLEIDMPADADRVAFVPVEHVRLRPRATGAPRA